MTALEYFRSERGFDRFLELCRKKYISLSHIGGKVRLDAPDKNERAALGGLLGRDIDAKCAELKLSDIDAALRNSRFGIGLEELLKEYFGDIVTKRTRDERDGAAREDLRARILNKYSDERIHSWLEDALSGNSLEQRRREDAAQLERDIDTVCRCLANLGPPQILPVFAAKICGDPHALDPGTPCGTLLTGALEHLSGSPRAASAAARSSLFESYGLYSDSVSSFVYCKNINLYLNDGTPHPAFEAFKRLNEPYTLNIGNLIGISRAGTDLKRVYITENPSVFTALSADSAVPLICTAGQPKSACMLLLRMLSGTRMLYSGDFDVGGFRIADRLLSEFGADMEPWHYTAEDYLRSVSKVKLNGVIKTVTPSLIPAAELANKHGFAGYQENIIDLLKKDVSR